MMKSSMSIILPDATAEIMRCMIPYKVMESSTHMSSYGRFGGGI